MRCGANTPRSTRTGCSALTSTPTRWRSRCRPTRPTGPAEIHAVGVHGSLAHGDDADGRDIDMVVVTFRPGAGLRPGARRIDGMLVDLGVISAEEYLEYARTLTTSWPIA